MKPTKKELSSAARVFGSFERRDSHYVTHGLAERHLDGLRLTALGVLAFACARLRDGKMTGYQPRCVYDRAAELRDNGLMEYVGEYRGTEWISRWCLTAKGSSLVALTGITARRERAVPAAPKSGTRLIANAKRAA